MSTSAFRKPENGLISLPKAFEQSQTIKIKESLIVPWYCWENNVGRLDNALDKNTNDVTG